MRDLLVEGVDVGWGSESGFAPGLVAERLGEAFFQVLDAGRFGTACLAAVTDPWLAGLPPVGSVDQVVDSTPVLSSIGTARRLRALYAAPPG